MAPVAGNPAGLDNPNDGRAEQQAGPRAGPGTEASGYLFDAARGARAMSATGTYVRAGLPEVVTALAVLTGEPHPLAPK